MRYFTQALAEDDPGRKDLLLDIATEELSHLYLQSALERKGRRGARAQSMKSSVVGTAIALNAAFLVNASILVLSRAVFSRAGLVVTDLGDAHRLLAPLLGTALAPLLFGVGLLLAGQSSTITSTWRGKSSWRAS